MFKSRIVGAALAIALFSLELVPNIGLPAAVAASVGRDIAISQSPDSAPRRVKPADIVMVLDNSGSMKRNDPDLLARRVVSDFAGRLPQDSRLEIVLVDADVKVVLDLTPADAADFHTRIQQSLEQLSYRGRRTNLPAAVERAVYDLWKHRRPEATSLVVLLTDGIVDVGNAASSAARARWLRDSLAPYAQRHDIRIHGVAFANTADLPFIQSIAEASGGEYFRALTAADIPPIFDQIAAALSKGPDIVAQTATAAQEAAAAAQEAVAAAEKAAAAAETTAAAAAENAVTLDRVGVAAERIAATFEPKADQEPGWLAEPAARIGLMASFLLLLVAGLAMGVALRRSRRRVPAVITATPAASVVPDAELRGLGSETAHMSFQVENNVTRIGRVPELNDVVIPRSTVSAQHAVIEYRGGMFYARDLCSKNGSFVNGQRFSDPERREIREVVIKNRDRLRFDGYEFEFLVGALEAAEETRLSGFPGLGDRWHADQRSEATHTDASDPMVPPAAGQDPMGWVA